MRRHLSIVSLTMILLLSGCHLLLQKKDDPSGGEQNLASIVPGSYYPVKKFVDGDTFWLDDGTETGIKIRLIGVDAPEPRNFFNIKEEPYGREASSHLKEMIGNKKVRLEYDVDLYDQYHRLLAYAFLENGIFINEQMVLDGFATIMTIPPNVKYQDQFLAAQKKARKFYRGIWAE